MTGMPDRLVRHSSKTRQSRRLLRVARNRALGARITYRDDPRLAMRLLRQSIADLVAAAGALVRGR